MSLGLIYSDLSNKFKNPRVYRCIFSQHVLLPYLSSCKFYSHKKEKKFSSTVLFPESDFARNPAKKKRHFNDLTVEKLAKFSSLYGLQEAKTDCRQKFILHDGPPYSNDKLHIGHALNKILKDIINRYHLMRGSKVDYRPGWDCHGLPIELKALEKMQKKENIKWHSLNPLEIRKKALTLAEESLQIQKEAFQLWGLLVDWDQIYATKNFSYVAKELNLFGKLYEDGFIFHAYMPVIYSPSSKTTLAEAELEYKQDHESPSLYLGFKAQKIPSEIKAELKIDDSPLYLPIWTTTPWTLPGNLAICVAPLKKYALVQAIIGRSLVNFLWLEENVKELPTILKINSYKILGIIQGSLLSRISYFNPFNNQICPVIPARHVTTSKGTGLVHTAPAHGKEDFVVALENDISTNVQLVDDRGCYNNNAGKDLEGKDVLTEGNDSIIAHIKKYEEDNSVLLFNLGKITHSYPYDWRSKKPTLIRASKQWFFNIKKIHKKVLDALEAVAFHPSHSLESFKKTITQRPYWCLSRQRSWGVPIPVFYDSQTQEPITSRAIIDHVAEIIRNEGPEAWWTLPEESLLPSDYVQCLRDENKPLPCKGKDILDIWFDSGSSWYCVLDGKKADFYVEGIDQLSGWFQSSLLTCVAATGEAPYKKLFIHDFVVDENHMKMSKSLGNVVDPVMITKGGKNLSKNPAYGVNVLRWWVASASTIKSIPLGENKLNKCDNELVVMRSLFWFLLANLGDFNPRCIINYAHLRPHDRYILGRLRSTLLKIWDHYEDCLFEEASSGAFQFMSVQFNHLYVESSKDILMCEAKDNFKRRCVQTVFHQALPHLLYMIAPILPHLAEEVCLHYSPLEEFHPFRIGAKEPPLEWKEDPKLSEQLQMSFEIKNEFTNRLSIANQPSSRNFEISIEANDSYFEALKILHPSRSDSHSALCDLLKVSHLTLEKKEDISGYEMKMSETKLNRCQRCLKNCIQNEEELCLRCKDVVTNLETINIKS